MIGFNTVIHTSAQANFSAFTYNTVVVGSANTSVVVNGTLMNLLAGTVLFDNFKVTSISGGTNVYLIGQPINVREGSTTLP
jgi:hypothetical protein